MWTWLLSALVWGISPTAYAANCSQPTTSLDVEGHLLSAEAAFSNVDIATFRAEVEAAVADAGCLDEVADRRVAAQLHRWRGLYAFGAGDENEANRSFSAAKSIEPYYAFPATVIPPGHPIESMYREAQSDPPSEPLIRYSGGAFWIDGRASETRLIDRPAIIQWVSDQGKVVLSTYAASTDPLPVPPAAAPAPPNTSLIDTSSLVPPTPPTKAKKSPAPRWAMVATAGALGAVSLGTFLGARKQEADFERIEVGSASETDLRRRQRLVNGLTVTAAVSLSVGVGVGVGAVFVTDF